MQAASFFYLFWVLRNPL